MTHEFYVNSYRSNDSNGLCGDQHLIGDCKVQVFAYFLVF